MSGKNPSSILARLLESGEFSDLKFLCKGDEFKVHKAIVCMQSPVIKAAIQGSFEVRLFAPVYLGEAPSVDSAW
ncbi:hypothetical protein FOPE_06597 [Fonsecaea pedrosoi]|nr:hypothetical protein FOPE_06597 [Fonsecaea pedrosoi]